MAEYLKTEGRDELEEFTRDLEQQVVALKKKHIRERKKTWLYKAEKARRKQGGTGPPILQRSVVRVSPEVDQSMCDVKHSVSHINQGMEHDDVDKPMSFDSLRQSSLSVFNEFRRARSPRVDPAPEGDLMTSSSLTLKDLYTGRT